MILVFISYTAAMKEKVTLKYLTYRIKELEDENKALDEELYRTTKLLIKSNIQVNSLIFERDMRLAKMRELEDKIKELENK